MFYALIASAVVIAVLALLLFRKPKFVAATPRDIRKAPAHVERFTRALEQSSDPKTSARLRKEIEKWRAIQSLGNS